jgi:hypothetical protein
MPPSRSASGAPQNKNFPGRPSGQRQLLLVNSISVFLCVVAVCAMSAGFLRTPLRRRRIGAETSLLSLCPADVGFGADTAEAWPEARRIRNTFPITADREVPPRRAAIAAAVSPAAHNRRKRSTRSGVHDWSGIAAIPHGAHGCARPSRHRQAVENSAGRSRRVGPATARGLVTVCVYSLLIGDSQVTILEARRFALNW